MCSIANLDNCSEDKKAQLKKSAARESDPPGTTVVTRPLDPWVQHGQQFPFLSEQVPGDGLIDGLEEKCNYIYTPRIAMRFLYTI